MITSRRELSKYLVSREMWHPQLASEIFSGVDGGFRVSSLIVVCDAR
jgi:hypothetical protein